MKTIFKKPFNRFINYTPISIAEIKAIRKQYNLSQRCFAEILSISLRSLQDYELGRIRPSQAASALFNLAKLEIDLFLKYLGTNLRPFER